MRPVNGWTANPAPASPSIFTSGVYQVHGGAPSHDALITLESKGTSSFKWKKNSMPKVNTRTDDWMDLSALVPG